MSTEETALLAEIRDQLKRIAEHLEAEGRAADGRAQFALRTALKDFGRFADPPATPTTTGTGNDPPGQTQW